MSENKNYSSNSIEKKDNDSNKEEIVFKLGKFILFLLLIYFID